MAARSMAARQTQAESEEGRLEAEARPRAAGPGNGAAGPDQMIVGPSEGTVGPSEGTVGPGEGAVGPGHRAGVQGVAPAAAVQVQVEDVPCPMCSCRTANAMLGCRHVCCLSCVFGAWWAAADGKGTRCHVCRAPVRFIMGNLRCNNPAQPADLAALLPQHPRLATTLQRVLDKRKSSRDTYDLLMQVACGLRGYLTVDAAETLLSLAKANGVSSVDVEKLLVRLCSQPWGIDARLTMPGLCYHGNFGELPGLMEAAHLLKYNRVFV